ncbi:hypothetical protein H5410_050798 [Solanum commersonii]|uniref:Uncharacterized protein n=1 Tax=Solanum commersonii TaxID=4109 RepID=A0A9J5WWJ4_SOLCO|nr:hypothetical protein H5410_050798 [Solanum commersonii]
MVIEIPIGKGVPVKATQTSKLSNELGIIAQNCLTLPNKWKELTTEEKDVALIRCHFEINLDGCYVKDSCEDIVKNRSRQWRYKLKKMFYSACSEEDIRKIEVQELTSENWNRLCDMWCEPKHKGEHYEGVEPDRIEFYKSIHYSVVKAIHTSGGVSTMTIDEIVDVVLGTKLGYIKGLGYGLKQDTTRATQRKATELEDSLK